MIDVRMTKIRVNLKLNFRHDFFEHGFKIAFPGDAWQLKFRPFLRHDKMFVLIKQARKICQTKGGWMCDYESGCKACLCDRKLNFIIY
jgi:hypothetical protein